MYLKMSRKQVAKLKQYIKDERPQRMKSYVHKHQLNLSALELKHNRNLLHYCCRHGTGPVLRYLIREKVNGIHADEALEFPLHMALNRALRYEESGRHEEATQCYTDLILPLLEEYPQVVDTGNVSGTTCRQLLNKLVKLRETAKPKGRCSERHGSSSDEDVDDRDEMMNERLWRDKLADELHFEYTETWGQYEEDFVSYEENTETYDDWTERIRQQYYDKKRAQREAEYAASSRKKRKITDKSELDDKETEKLEEERRKMKKKYERNQAKDTELKLLKRKVKYENEYKTLFERKDKGDLGYSDIPWPGGDKSEDDIVILQQGLEKDSSDYRKYFREQRIRWHPDKFLQRFGVHIVSADKERILKRVTDLSQKLNKLSQ